MRSSFLPVPKVAAPLDPGFRPAGLAESCFQELSTRAGGSRIPLAFCQPDGAVMHDTFTALPESHPEAANANPFFFERFVKFRLWAWGAQKVMVQGPESFVRILQARWNQTPEGRFDSEIVGQRIYDRPLEAEQVHELPPARTSGTPLGRHWDGCRIGFDLGGSDRKVAAVIDGRCVFSEETVWDPYFQPDPEYHRTGIQDSLERAAKHMPRVDAIGGSAAGVYVANVPKVASLFRGVSPERFRAEVRPMFSNIRAAWNNVPLEVANDGEVTALAAAMKWNVTRVLGIALGTSTAGGWVDAAGNITPWLNELAYVPLDYQPQAPREEWSGDIGVGAQYFSQQAVARLVKPAGITGIDDLPNAEKLKQVQTLMAQEDPRARKIYQTLGVYLGYGLAQMIQFYGAEHLLLLGRVTSGSGGEIMQDVARSVWEQEFPGLADRVKIHRPDETDKRHGQAIAAASLPRLSS